jgi:hypothetical protein
MRNRVRGKRRGSPIRSLRIEISRRSRIRTNSKMNRIRNNKRKKKRKKIYKSSQRKMSNHIYYNKQLLNRINNNSK